MKNHAEKIKNILIKGAELATFSALIYFLANCAIDRKTRQSLEERAGNRCESSPYDQDGEKRQGRCNTVTNLEVAHMQHGDNRNFNKLENVKLFCIRCHFFDHLYRKRNNLSKGENSWTLYQIWHRMTPTERVGIPEPSIPMKNNHYRR